MRFILLTALRLYRLAISPAMGALGARCRFHPSCSEYAEAAIATRPLPRALALIALRVLRCNPWCEGGLDPVPQTDAEGR